MRRLLQRRILPCRLVSFVLLAWVHVSAAQSLWISEFMASNSSTLEDEDGESSDWVEIFNPSAGTVSLAGWFLTDDTNAPAKWRFPEVALAPNGYLVVFASDKNRLNPATNLHTNFKLSTDGEYLALLDPATNVVSRFFPAYPPQQTDISYGRDRLEPNQLGYYAVPTPGRANEVSGAGFAPPTLFSQSSTAFQHPFMLTLQAGEPVPNVVIRYTLNGTRPTNGSPAYSSPLLISDSIQVRARAFRDGYLPGPLRSEIFFALGSNVVDVASDLPIILLHTLGGGLVPVDGERFAGLAVFEPRFGRTSLLEAPDLVTRCRINLRGNTTLVYPKQSLNFEAWDEFDSDRDIGLLGMPADSDWVFYGPNNLEPALIHNPFIHELSRRIGRYSPRTRFAEVYLNTTGGAVESRHYNGIYVIEEKIKIAPERIATDELELEHVNSPEITGGYLLKIDFLDAGETGLTVAGQRLIFVEPKEREIHLPAWRPQKLYLSNYFHEFYSALTGPNSYDPLLGYAAYIDRGSWIDHHLLNVLAKNVDGLGLSEFLYKPRAGRIVSGPFWDFDRAFNSTDGRDTDPGIGRAVFSNTANYWGGSWWSRLFRDPDFFQQWIDRYQSLRRGPLATHNLHALVDTLVAQVLEAQPREQARWGANAPPRGGYANEVNLMKNWLADRAYFMDTNFLASPRFNSEGGPVSAGFTFSMLVPAGATGYYTLDGSDPRASGGGIATQALIYTQPLALDANVRAVARSYHPGHRNLTGAQNPPLSSPWSGPSEATFIVKPPPLAVTEIMYHPALPPGGVIDADDFEFIELKNFGSTTVDLTGVRFTNGIEFTFTPTNPITSLAPGGYVLLVKSRAAFVSRYGERSNIAGEYGGRLDNGGERLYLEGALREPILDFAYRDDWYRVTDGFGFSLVIVNELAPRDAWGLRANWRPSTHVGGSPGEPDPPPPRLPAVVLNEILTHPAGGGLDTVELWNPTGAPADISNWFLSDDEDEPRKFRFPAGTVISPGEFLLVNETAFDAPGDLNGFAFSSRGGEAWLFSADAAGKLTGYAHRVELSPSALGVTFGRHVDGLGGEHFPAQSASTLGAVNAGPLVGPIVISEIMYHPPDRQVGAAGVDNNLDEYIELRNLTSQPVSLFDVMHPTNTWQLRGGVEFSFPTGLLLAPDSHALVVGFRSTDEARLNAFRARFGVPEAVPIFGPFLGKLDNSADRVDLARPATPIAAPAPDAGEVDYVLVERVSYSEASPWPESADGTGLSLHRANEGQFGNDPAQWLAAHPSPGSRFAGGAPPVITSQPADVRVAVSQAATFQVLAEGLPPLGYSWRFGSAAIPGATNATLALEAVQPEQAGDYSVVVFNQAGAVLSRAARLTVAPPPLISHGPNSRSVQPGMHVTNTVIASGVGPLRYQWLLDGVPLPDATNATLVLTNAHLGQAGTYVVTVTDDISFINTRPANLVVLQKPQITQQPQPAFQTALEGDTVTFFVGATPIHPTLPMRFVWRRNSATIPGQTNATLTFVLTNVIPDGALAATNNFNVFVINPATIGEASAVAVVLVLADTDRDRMADGWENTYGFNRNDPSDAAFDADGDGLSNLQEFTVGTDPTNRLSRFAISLRMESEARRSLLVDAISNKTYSVLWRESLDRGRWATLTNLSASPANLLTAVPDPYPQAAGRLYRLVTPQTGQTPPPGPVILTSPASSVVYDGDPAEFGVFAVGAQPLSYQWLFDGSPLAGETQSMLRLPEARTNRHGPFSVAVGDARGSVTSEPARLTVLVRPVILEEPQDLTVAPGGMATFRVEATGFEPLGYFWIRNHSILRGQTNAMLVLPSAQPADAGMYSVLVWHNGPTGRAAIRSRSARLEVAD